MAEIPITIFSNEALRKDFVWLKRKAGFESERRPTIDQCEPRDLSGQAFTLQIVSDRGVALAEYPVDIVDPIGGRLQLFAPNSLIVKQRGRALRFHVMTTEAGEPRRVFGGTLTVQAI